MTDLRFSPATVDQRELLKALRAFRKGDFTVRMPLDLVGIDGEIAAAFNDVVEMNETFAEEFARIRDEVGKEGKINQRIKMPAATGAWADCVESVNTLIGDVVNTATRLNGIAHAGQIILSPHFVDALPPDWRTPWALRPIDRVQLKGKQEPMLIYEVEYEEVAGAR